MRKKQSPSADVEITGKDNSDKGSDPYKEMLAKLQQEHVFSLLGLSLCPCAEWPPAVLKVISASPCSFRAQLLICCADTVAWVLFPGLLSHRGLGRQLLSSAVSLLHAAWETWLVRAVHMMSEHEVSVQGQQTLTVGV